MKTVIFTDSSTIDVVLSAPRAEAANIQNLLGVIGSVATSEGQAPALSGMALVKALAAGHFGTAYLRSIMVVQHGDEALLNAIHSATFDGTGKAIDLNLFFINGEGMVEAVEEAATIEEYTYYSENADQEEYLALAEAFVTAHNALETFLQAHHKPGIASNVTMAYNTERMEYVFRDEYKDYNTVSVNLRSVNDFK